MASWNPDDGPDVDALAELLRSLEGSLIEIYVFHADRQMWKNAVDALSDRAEGLEIAVDGRPVDVAHFGKIDFDDDSTRVLRAHVRGVEWTSTLFREDQVEFQAAPEDFPDREAVASLIDVLEAIADATGGEAVLVPETVRPAEASPLASARPTRHRPGSDSTDAVGCTSGS